MKTFNHIYEDFSVFCEFVDAIDLKENENILIRIHSGIHTKVEMEELTAKIKELLPWANIVGCSVSKVILEGDILPDRCLISVTVLEKNSIITGHLSCMDEAGNWKSGEAVGEEMLQVLPSAGTGFMLLFFPVDYSKMEAFTNTINDADVSVKIFGGAAYYEDENHEAQTDLAYCVADTFVSTTELSYAYISGEELSVYGNYVCGVEAVGRPSKVHTKGNEIISVDGQPGATWYAKMLGESALQETPEIAQVFPLIMRDGSGLAYHIDYLKDKGRNKYKLQSFGELLDGSEISIGYFYPQKIYNRLSHLMNGIVNHPAETIFAYDCQARSNLLHDCAAWECGNFSNTNMSGALLSGELIFNETKNFYANYTFVVTALSEGGKTHFILPDLDPRSIEDLQEDNIQMLAYLLQNAHKHLNNDLAEQQGKMRDAVFFNAVMGLQNQMKFQYDEEELGFDKSAVLSLNNEKMLRLFSGLAETYTFLKHCYEEVQELYEMDGLHFYSIEDVSLLVAADDRVEPEEFKRVILEIEEFLNNKTFNDIDLNYTAAILLEAGSTIPRLMDIVRYAKSRKLPYACNDEVNTEIKKTKEDIQMVWIIKEALWHRRILPYFQEIHNNQGGTKRMFESLMRIFDEDGNIYYPNSFLPVAKEYELYDSLSELMVKMVMEQFENKDARITINLSVQDIYNRNLIQFIFGKLRECNHPENFVFEIVESEEVTDYQYMKEFADRIHECGGMIAIDDFGSGFSNIKNILNINADFIKVDGAIVKTVVEDVQCREFIEFINGWCKKAGQELICEFIENEQIQKIMEEIGVGHSQGYFFSKPHKWSEEDEA